MPDLDYKGYLKLDELLKLQQPLADPPSHDESLFIIVHQVFELWFKLALHEIDKVFEMLDQDDVIESERLIRRLTSIVRLFVPKLSVLETMMPSDFIQFRDRLAEQVASIPGVQGVSLASSLYLAGSNILAVEGRTFSRDRAEYNVANDFVDDNFLQVMGIPLLHGRGFGSEDRRSTQPVALINQALAERYFPNEDPIGHEIKMGPPEGKNPWLTIIGIVGNVKTVTVFQEMGYVTPPAVYQPFAQNPPDSMSLFVRTHDDPNAAVDPLEQKLQALDADITLANVKTMKESLAELQSQPRFRTILLSAFAALALVLAALGIYGVLMHSVVRRTREIGVRMALGATRGSVLRMILKQALSTVVIGLASGLIAAVFLVRLAAGLLYDVRPDNPWILASVSAVLILVALCASYFPARRATRIDPLEALRSE